MNYSAVKSSNQICKSAIKAHFWLYEKKHSICEKIKNIHYYCIFENKWVFRVKRLTTDNSFNVYKELILKHFKKFSCNISLPFQWILHLSKHKSSTGSKPVTDTRPIPTSSYQSAQSPEKYPGLVSWRERHKIAKARAVNRLKEI